MAGKQVQCMRCGKQFWSKCEKIRVVKARDKENPTKVRILGGVRTFADTESFKVEPNENKEVEKVLAPQKQLCKKCENEYRQFLQRRFSQQKKLESQRKGVIAPVTEEDYKNYLKYNVNWLLQKEQREKAQKEKQEAEKRKSNSKEKGEMLTTPFNVEKLEEKKQ